jgi:general secretion pathway protein K
VLALATVLAYALREATRLGLERSADQARAAQAYQFQLGLEDFARQVLTRDLIDVRGTDHRGEPWAGAVRLPVPGGEVWAQLTVLDGRFDLYSLIRDGRPDALAIEVFARLLSSLGLDPAIAQAAADWIDADPDPSGRGGEDLDYLRATPPYRAANRRFVHPGELLWVRGVDEAGYRRLRPYVAALPEPTSINLNAAAPALLQALVPGLNPEQAKRLSGEQGARYDSVESFLEEVVRIGLLLDPRLRERLGVRSRYFQARSVIVLDGYTYRYGAVLDRGARERSRAPIVLQRTRGGFD